MVMIHGGTVSDQNHNEVASLKLSLPCRVSGAQDVMHFNELPYLAGDYQWSIVMSCHSQASRVPQALLDDPTMHSLERSSSKAPTVLTSLSPRGQEP